MLMLLRTVAPLILMATVDAAAACRADSDPERLALVELYTSEGCSSCPPADRWLSRTFPPDAPGRAAVLAFHVDYWDRLGWKDRFAAPAYAERQYALARANASNVVVTPQVFVSGRPARDWPGPSREDIVPPRRPASARLAIEVDVRADRGEVRALVGVDRTGGAAMVVSLAYADSAHVTRVSAGENRGEHLRHDHVVRALASKTASGSDRQVAFTLPLPREAGARPKVVAFVQATPGGEVLQAVELPLSDCPAR